MRWSPNVMRRSNNYVLRVESSSHSTHTSCEPRRIIAERFIQKTVWKEYLMRAFLNPFVKLAETSEGATSMQNFTSQRVMRSGWRVLGADNYRFQQYGYTGTQTRSSGGHIANISERSVLKTIENFVDRGNFVNNRLRSCNFNEMGVFASWLVVETSGHDLDGQYKRFWNLPRMRHRETCYIEVSIP